MSLRGRDFWQGHRGWPRWRAAEPLGCQHPRSSPSWSLRSPPAVAQAGQMCSGERGYGTGNGGQGELRTPGEGGARVDPPGRSCGKLRSLLPNSETRHFSSFFRISHPIQVFSATAAGDTDISPDQPIELQQKPNCSSVVFSFAFEVLFCFLFVFLPEENKR